MANGGIIGPVNNPTADLATGVWEQEEQYQAQVGGIWPPIPAIGLNSCRFNKPSSDTLTRTPGSTGNQKTATYSTWIKLSSTAIEQMFFTCGVYLSTSLMQFYFNANGTLTMSQETSGGSIQSTLTTTQVFRDPSAWYHIVVATDTTQGTDTNRIKLYVNGTQITSFSTATYPSVNADFAFNTSGVINTIGNRSGGSFYFDGYMSETILVDGTALAATSFGESDANGFWKPIIPAVPAYGTNGFRLKYEDASSLGTDSSPNGNNLTVNNLTSIDQTTDYPVNNFATWNPLIKTTAVISEGNLKYTAPGSNPVFGSLSTIGVTSGKWYAELNYTSGTSHKLVLGVADESFDSGNTTASYDLGKSGTTSSIAYVVNTGAYRINNSNTSWGSGGGDGQIINIAIDRDNEKLYFGVDGTWGNSSDPASNTGGIPTTALNDTAWFLGITNDTSGTGDVGEINFGNPSFSISSGNADGNGYGDFEYAVPSGYLALNTANLSEELS